MKLKYSAIAFAVLLAGCHTSKQLTGMPIDDYKIDQPIEQLEGILANLEQQQPRNYTIANISFLYEIKLHLVFEQYLASLSEDKRPTAIEEQKKWQKLHDKRVSDAFAEFEGGSYAGFNAGEAAVKDYKARIDEISKHIQPVR